MFGDKLWWGVRVHPGHPLDMVSICWEGATMSVDTG